MTFIEQAIKEDILADAGVIAEIGNRLYSRNPQLSGIDTVYPWVKYQRISTARDYHLTGDSGLKNPRIQFVVYSDTSRATALTAAQAMIAFLSGYSAKSETPRIDAVFIEGPNALEQEQDTRLWPVQFDARIWTDAD